MAVVRAHRPAPLREVLRTVVEAGIRVLEVTLPTPGALDAVTWASAEFGDDVLVGTGTVLTADEVRATAAAGGRFVVSPHTDPAVIAAAGEAGIGSLPGAATPTEILTAWRHGPTAVKVFPAGGLGPDFVRGVRAPLPHVPLVPTGGVGVPELGAYLRAGALAVGVGSPLLGDALDGGSLDELRSRAARFVRAAEEDR